MSVHRYRLGVDIGGTFTDFVVTDEESGEIFANKVLTTPDDPARAVEHGLRSLLEAVGTTGQHLAVAIHGTTLFTNTLIERTGAKTALITTDGFRDIIEMGKEMRYDVYDLHIRMPEPLVPRPLRFEVPERMDNRGSVLVPLDEAAVREVARALVAEQVEAVAICYLNSFMNGAQEERTQDLVREAVAPDVAISISSQVAPEIREYERTSTTVANAYVQPLAETYLGRIQEGLERQGYREQLYLMLSSGGITSLETARRFPVRLVESGPAAGVLAAVFYGRLLDKRNVISFDMGGTTAKIGLIVDGQPEKTKAFEVARVHRFRKGSGLPISVPAIELIEIGAGGGSIASINELGLLKVGPRSAGAAPGPACYGLGGTLPTVTDADLLLGYLNPDYFLGGRMRLDVDAAAGAMEDLCARLGLPPIEVAAGIHRVVNESMVSATRVQVAERGQDARRFSLVAFGGAGPVHAYEIARALKIREIICPPNAGVASALGFLTAPISFDLANSYPRRLRDVRVEDLAERVLAMEREARGLLRHAGVAADQIEVRHSADMRHVGQGYEINVPLPGTDPRDIQLDALARHFYGEYERLYEHTYGDLGVELMTLRVLASGPDPRIRVATGEGGSESVTDAYRGERRAFFLDHGFLPTKIYQRKALRPGAVLAGPAVVEAVDSTAVVAPGMSALVDRFGSLVISLTEAVG